MKDIPKPFRTDFYLWNGVAALFFSAYVTDLHSHNTMQLFIDLQHGFKCRLSGGDWQNYHTLILRENVIHQLDTNGSVQLLIYLDADSLVAKQLKAKYLQGQDAASPAVSLLALLHPEEVQNAMLHPDPALLGRLIGQIFRVLTDTPTATRRDERITKAEEMIAVGTPATLSIQGLADAVCLSESRLRALFKQQTGTSIYRYLLWARLRYGINLLMTGKPVGEAALEAGFSDSSHFHKMLVQMFGLGPAAFLKSNRYMEMVTCDDVPLRFETNIYDKEERVVRRYQ
jgi:AraC-like DNA-binding protein